MPTSLLPVAAPECAELPVSVPEGAIRHVMVVDDSRVQRRILASQLARAGYKVREAASAEEAMGQLAVERPDMIISDWMMPGMTGLDLCATVRRQACDHYIYFILLTSKNDAAEVARGLETGADDFLTKPVNGDELRARLAAGERILAMERELRDSNRLLSSTLDELQGLYDSLNRDLMEAQKLQQSLVRERHRSFGNSEVTLLLRPSGLVGGDLVGFFPITGRRVGLFAIDVSGHGITAAMMTARLAGYLSGSSPEQNIALTLTEFGIYDALPPAELARTLNRLVLSEMRTETYFTLAYADVDLISGVVELVQAGHPHPAILRADGGTEYLGGGGLPIGLVGHAGYEGTSARLMPGDRLLLMSDGITEATDGAGRQLGEDGLQRILARAHTHRGQAFLDALVADLSDFTGARFDDDISGVFFEFLGPTSAAG